MTPEREAYKTAAQALKLIEAERHELVKPTDSRYRAAIQALEDAREAIGADLVGQCETCMIDLFEGDKGHACGDGPYLCEVHSPTYGNVLSQYEAMLADGELPEMYEGTIEDFRREVDEMRARSDLDQKALHTL